MALCHILEAYIAPTYFCICIQTADTPEMKELMAALYHKVADKWKVIGVQLDIGFSNLTSIETKNQNNPHLCLLDMLEVWLKRVDPSPTWLAIIEAVEFLGEEQLGRDLRMKYCL